MRCDIGVGWAYILQPSHGATLQIGNQWIMSHVFKGRGDLQGGVCMVSHHTTWLGQQGNLRHAIEQQRK